MNNLIKISAVLATLFLMGCASVNSLSLTPVPANRGKTVKAQVEKFIILGFNFDNDFVEPLVNDLKQQCPNGTVSGILTKDEVISYLIAHTRKVTATGFCSSGGSARASAKRTSASEDSNE